MKRNEYDKTIRELMFTGSVALCAESQEFNEDLFIGIHDILTLSEFLNQLGFGEQYLVLNTDSIYTENRLLIEFCKEYNIPLKVYHNFSSETVVL